MEDMPIQLPIYVKSAIPTVLSAQTLLLTVLRVNPLRNTFIIVQDLNVYFQLIVLLPHTEKLLTLHVMLAT